MPREKEFQRKKKDTRMPVRDSHAEERMDTRQSEQDFNLLRVRDAPSSSGTARSRRYETAAQQAADDTAAGGYFHTGTFGKQGYGP